MCSNKQAFTLIELLVVVLIIGILAAVAVPKYQKAILKSRFTQAKIMANALVQAEETYYLANGAYTWNLDNLDISFDFSTATSNGVSGISCSDETRSCYYRTMWGRCDLSQTDVFCNVRENNESKMAYLRYFANSSDKKGKTFCGSYKDDPGALSYQICQAETGQRSPSFKGSAAYFLY